MAIPIIGSPNESPKIIQTRFAKYIADKFQLMSPAKAMALLPRDQRDLWLATLAEAELSALQYDWNFWARPAQRIPDTLPNGKKWKTAVICCGRGWGKTRVAAEFVRRKITSGECRHMALVGPSANDVRKVMVEDVRTFGSGMMQVCPPEDLPEYSPTRRLLYWEKYDAACSLYSGEEPELLRGPAHDGAWVDEIMRMKKQEAVWDMLQFGLRGATNAQVVVTTTPKPTDLMRQLVVASNTIVIGGSTVDNDILPEDYLAKLYEDYGGSRLGQQELSGLILDDVEGALWSHHMIEDNRLRPNDDGMYQLPTFGQIVIGVDPQTGKSLEGAKRKTMTGIVVVAVSKPIRGIPQHAYVLCDGSLNGTPEEWGKRVVQLYKKYNANLIVLEGNQGGKMAVHIIQSVDRSVKIRVVTAVTKKDERAAPVVAKYEQNRVHHAGIFDLLEAEMTTYTPGDEDRHKSPDRLDALVWALRHLLVSEMMAGAGISIQRRI